MKSMRSYLRLCVSYKKIQCTSLSLSLSNRYYSVEKINFPERTVQIRTCGDLYKKWKEENLFLKLPESDLIFNVPYIDTFPDCSNYSSVKKARTVLLLHGAPGSWRDFNLLSSYLHQLGHRVIAPSFPDFHVYRPGIYRHSDLEKAQYLKDFLGAISVSHIDTLICHSSSIYPGLNLILSHDLKIKSLVLLNPGTFGLKKMSSTRHFTLLKSFVKAGENPILLKIMESFGPFILKNILKVQVRFESILDPLLSATTMVYGQILESKEKFQQIVALKLPVLFVFSENDSLISCKPSYELAELLGACTSDVFLYNSEGVLVQKGKASATLKVLAFQQGSHYVFLKYSKIINKEIADFLNIY